MRVIPKNYAPQIVFCETRLGPWAEHAESIGVTPEQVAELAALTQAAREALKAQHAAQQAAENATLRFRLAREAMTGLASVLVKQIRTRAAADGNGVYSLALIPPPADASPIGSPGTPTRFTAELQQVGWLLLRWQCKNPRGAEGTMYQIHRRIEDGKGGGGPFEFLGVTGKKQFLDQTLPAGSPAVTYQVQAIRSTAVGPIATHTINLGTTPGSLPPAMMQMAG